MNKSSGVLLILAIIIALLLCTESTFVLSQTSSNTPVSAPAIEWQQEYESKTEYVSNVIQTSDGGYAFMDRGWTYQFMFGPSRIYKVDSLGNIQWNKTINFFFASTIIQTNDEGYQLSGRWHTYGTTYEYTPTLIKTDSQGNIQWVANYSSVPDLGISNKAIETSDGGYAYLTEESITKTDSKNNTEWTKNLTISFAETQPPYNSPSLEMFSLTETADGALAAVGVGKNLYAWARWGNIYFVKTEAFLPLPSQTPLPTPVLTPIPTPTPTPLPTQNVEVIALASLIIGMVVGASLMLFLKKRRH
jgi:hypothetical protein